MYARHIREWCPLRNLRTPVSRTGGLRGRTHTHTHFQHRARTTPARREVRNPSPLETSLGDNLAAVRPVTSSVSHQISSPNSLQPTLVWPECGPSSTHIFGPLGLRGRLCGCRTRRTVDQMSPLATGEVINSGCKFYPADTSCAS